MMMTRSNREAGVIAIFLSVIMGILLLTATTFAARVAASELNQSSQVDQSEAAYYAAEAGVEEAIRRLAANPLGAPCQIFPEQYGLTLSTIQSINCPATATMVGDYAILDDGISAGNTEGAHLAIRPESNPAAASEGNVSWRSRRVTANGSSFSGTQVKDESVQFDTSELCRHSSTGQVYGTAACNPDAGNLNKDPLSGGQIANSFLGMQYCWSGNAGQHPDIEMTNVYWSASNINNVRTEKLILSYPYTTTNASFASGLHLYVTTGSSAIPNESAYNYCAQMDTSSATARANRFIFRFKPLFPGVSGNARQQNAYSISYHATLDDAQNGYLEGLPLYLATNTYLIDVVGEAGGIKRRIVATVTRNGGVLGIFDYLIYSGGDGSSLCKPGVEQLEGAYDTDSCSPYSATNTTDADDDDDED